MQKFSEVTEYDLLAKVYMVKSEYLGRQGSVYDDYRGQFFWQINDVNCTDWDARYIFEHGELKPDKESLCKIFISENLKKYSKGNFPIKSQFCIREGARVVGIGVILECNVGDA